MGSQSIADLKNQNQKSYIEQKESVGANGAGSQTTLTITADIMAMFSDGKE